VNDAQVVHRLEHGTKATEQPAEPCQGKRAVARQHGVK
jgi:hypothetical protein